MYLTNKKVAVMGAAGAIGSNLVQDLLSTGTANRIAMYDPYAKGLEGAAEEIFHCAYPGAEITWTTDVAEALSGASYVISSGGAPRREGMTREDLLIGNCEIARQLGEDICRYAPGAEFVIVIFNPADAGPLGAASRLCQHVGGFGQHPSPARAGQALRCPPRRSYGVCNVWRPR